ncbi:hypothetical protein Esti_000903 [Eimeria stiedai]
MSLPVFASSPSLLLCCGSAPRQICSMSDGRICQLTGTYLSVSDYRGTTQYVPLPSNTDAEFGHTSGSPIRAFTVISSHGKGNLLAIGASGVEGEVQLLQLLPEGLQCLGRNKLAATNPTEVLSLDFSSCGLYLFCVSRGLARVPKHHRLVVVHELIIYNVSNGKPLVSKLLQWDDERSLPARVLGGSGGVAAVFSETNLMLVELRQNAEDKLATSGLLLPADASQISETPLEGVRICGACWASSALEEDRSCSSNLLFLSLSSKFLLAVEVGFLGAEGPCLVWAINTEQVYNSLSAELGTGIVLGCTGASCLDIFKLNEAAMQDIEASHSNVKEIHPTLSECKQVFTSKTRYEKFGKAGAEDPFGGNASAQWQKKQYVPHKIATANQNPYGFSYACAGAVPALAPANTGSALRLLNSRVSPSSTRLLIDAAGFVWGLHQNSESVSLAFGTFCSNTDKALLDADHPLILLGVCFDELVGMRLATERTDPSALKLTLAHASGKVDDWQLLLKVHEGKLQLSLQLEARHSMQQTIDCLGIIQESGLPSDVHGDDQNSRCLLGLGGGYVGWMEANCSNSIRMFQISHGCIKTLLGRKFVRHSPAHSELDASFLERAKPKATFWAAVCSSGEVVLFFRVEEADVDAAEQREHNCISIFSRFSLTAWFSGRNPKGPTALAEAGEWAEDLVSPNALQLPKGCGCWLEAADEADHDHEEPGHETSSNRTTGLFALGLATTIHRGSVGAVAFLPSHLNARGACSDSKIRCARLGFTPLCISSEGPLLAVGTAWGSALVFCTRDLLSESYTNVAGFAKAPGCSAPRICVSCGASPLQRVHLWSCEADSSASAVGAVGEVARNKFHLVALGAEGVVHGAQLQNFPPDKPHTAISADRAQFPSNTAANWNVLASSPAPPTMSSSTNLCSNFPLLTITHANPGAVLAVICWEPGIMQLWVLPSPPAASSTAVSTSQTKHEGGSTPIIIRITAPTRDESLLAMQAQNKPMGIPAVGITKRPLGQNETHPRCLHRMSLKPTAAEHLERFLSEKCEIQHQLQALIQRIIGNPKLSELRGEAATIDAELRSAAKQRASAACNKKQQHLLLLQQAFKAFQQNLLKHLERSTCVTPKKICFPAEAPGEQISVQNYIVLTQEPKEMEMAKKFLFLRKVQWAEETWLKQVLPIHESVVQMQQVDLAPSLDSFGENAEAYLIYHGQANSKAAEATAMSASTAPVPGEFAWPNDRADIYKQESLSELSKLVQKPLSLATSASRRTQFWILLEISAEIRASFNQKLDDSSKRLVRGIEQMQQQAAKARECALQLTGHTESSTDGALPVFSASDAIKDLEQSCNSEIWVMKTVSSSAACVIADGSLKESAIAGVLRSVSSKGIFEANDKKDASEGEPEPFGEAEYKALEKMMGGKRKAKTPFSVVELKADKWEPWMDTVDPVAMTETQAMRFAAYKEQQRAIKEKEEALRTKVEGDLKRLRDEFDSTAAQLRDDLRSLQAVGRVYEKERLIIELAISRLIQKIEREKEAEAEEAISRARHATSKELLQQLQQELQKQQGVCWLLEDEMAVAQQSQKEKAATLSAAQGSGQVSPEALATLNKRLHEALCVCKSVRKSNLVEDTEDPEQVFREECVALSECVDKAFEELKDVISTGPEGPLRKILEASRDSIYAQQRLVLASEAADAEQRKLDKLKNRLEERQREVSELQEAMEESLSALKDMQLDADLLLRVRQGALNEIPACIAKLQEPFSFGHFCLVNSSTVETYKQEIIAGGRQKLRGLQAIAVCKYTPVLSC